MSPRSGESNYPPQPEYDFWEFVACARCHLPFLSESNHQPQVPFWITECGHVICNNHLNADQSCAECGSQTVQVAPLQREMEAPMSDWFRPATEAIDSVAYSIRFQLETLASLVRYYKRKCSQQRGLLERAKNDALEKRALQKRVGELQAEVDYMRGQTQYEPSQIPDANGKRRMVDVGRQGSGARSYSSPRSITTPIGPDRLTLPPTHQQPSFPVRQQHHSDDGPYHRVLQSSHGETVAIDRPGSSRFMQ
ncbi:hypothetical protein K474DRAFT_1585303 [Panus rudis PR-1116 ss-1]|nr:hypothetical protein K474DRAFT_1585303 [Panus rudis PR-1116 ss-1]